MVWIIIPAFHFHLLAVKPWRRHHRLPWSNVIQFHGSYWIVDSACGLWGTKQIWCGPQLTADHQFIWRFSLQRATWMSWSISLKKCLQWFGNVLPLVNLQQWPLQGVHKSLSLAIGLWMIRCCSKVLDSICSIELCKLLWRELRSVIRYLSGWNSEPGK